MVQRISNEQEFLAVQRDADTQVVHQFEKIFLLSRVLTLENYVWPFVGDDGRPKTYIGTEDGGFIVLAPYDKVKKLWLDYRAQNCEVKIISLAN